MEFKCLALDWSWAGQIYKLIPTDAILIYFKITQSLKSQQFQENSIAKKKKKAFIRFLTTCIYIYKTDIFKNVTF